MTPSDCPLPPDADELEWPNRGVRLRLHSARYSRHAAPQYLAQQVVHRNLGLEANLDTVPSRPTKRWTKCPVNLVRHVLLLWTRSTKTNGDNPAPCPLPPSLSCPHPAPLAITPLNSPAAIFLPPPSSGEQRLLGGGHTRAAQRVQPRGASVRRRARLPGGVPRRGGVVRAGRYAPHPPLRGGSLSGRQGARSVELLPGGGGRGEAEEGTRERMGKSIRNGADDACVPWRGGDKDESVRRVFFCAGRFVFLFFCCTV